MRRGGAILYEFSRILCGARIAKPIAALVKIIAEAQRISIAPHGREIVIDSEY
jgi:hypothetical protein